MLQRIIGACFCVLGFATAYGQISLETLSIPDLPTCGVVDHEYVIVNNQGEFTGFTINFTPDEAITIVDVTAPGGTWNGSAISWSASINNPSINIQVQYATDCADALPVFTNVIAEANELSQAFETNVNFNTLAPSLNIVAFSGESIQTAPGSLTRDQSPLEMPEILLSMSSTFL